MNRSNRLTRLALLAALFALPLTAAAGGLGISEFGSQASGRGYAAAALFDDPSAVFYNPANVSRLEGVQVAVGAAAMMPRFSYTPVSGSPEEKTDSTVLPPPHLSATWMLGNFGIGDTALGVGFYIPYGSTFSWPAGWSGREQIEQISLNVFEVSPVLSVRPAKWFSLGAGFRYLPAQVYLKQAVDFGTQKEGQVELGGSGDGMGASAGLSVFPADWLSLALTWRSAVTLKFKGNSNFQFPAPFEPDGQSGTVATQVPLAQVFRFGVAADVIPHRFNLSADLEYSQWSTFKELSITFIDPSGHQTVQSSPKNEKDSFTVHVGGEYKITDAFAVRAGYVWDQHTVPEATVNPAPPDSDLHIITVGASYYFGRRFALHAHVEDVIFAKRTSTTSDFPGTWQGGYPGGTMAWIFGLTASMALDVSAPFQRHAQLGAPPASSALARATPF